MKGKTNDTQNFGSTNLLYPSLTTIVGAEVDGKPNWMTIDHVGIMNHGGKGHRQFISIGCHPSHYTNAGIRKNCEFSVNIPGRDLLVKTDHMGIVSGKTCDKSTFLKPFMEDSPMSP